MNKDKAIRWAVEIDGPRSRIERLETNTAQWALAEVEGCWELELSGVDADTDGNVRLDRALQQVVRINGHLNASLGRGGAISVKRMVEYFPGRERVASVPLRLLVQNTRLGGFDRAAADNTVGLPSPSDLSDQRLQEYFLDLWGQPDAFAFTGLYKIIDLITKSDKTKIVNDGRFKSRLDDFKRTANDPAIGPEARHANLDGLAASKSGKAPMSLAAAEDFVRELYDEFQKRRGWEVL
jgi:hypothetical protein